MARRKPDVIRVETDSGTFDRFESLDVVNDIAGITEATMQCGDDSSFPELEQIVKPGQPFRVYCNDHLRLTGRAEINEVPGSCDAGVSLQLTCRTKMSDATYSRAPESLKVEGQSLRKVILAAYADIGITEADFVFGEFTDVEIMTGRSAKGRAPFEPDSITPDKAKVQPPETIREFVERHLKRYKATHWDGPDGKILVGRPDDAQSPLYTLKAKRGPASIANNLTGFRRVKDWTEVPAFVIVEGRSAGTCDVPGRSLRETAIQAEVAEVAGRTGHFNRTVFLQDKQAKNAALAARTAAREMSSRVRRMNAWELFTDGWSFWTGSEQIDWAINTTVDVDVDAVGGVSCGRYLIVRTSLKLDIGGGPTTGITVVAPGIWQL
jgi:hypothetical protein